MGVNPKKVANPHAECQSKLAEMARKIGRQRVANRRDRELAANAARLERALDFISCGHVDAGVTAEMALGRVPPTEEYLPKEAWPAMNMEEQGEMATPKKCPECGSDEWARLNMSCRGAEGNEDQMNAHLCQNEWHAPPSSPTAVGEVKP